MAIVQNTYTGNGSTTLYSLSFPYLDATDVKVTLNGAATTAYVFVNASTIQFITAPAAGVAIRIYRETDIESQTATFFAGSAIRAQDLNDNLTQTLYAVQESNFEADTATSTANTALTNSNTAISTANTASTNASNAVTTANTASANASAAVSTANTANTNASNAVTTANTASSNASAAVTTANTALSTANSATTTANNAVSTANSALTAANNAVSTANTASSNATTAVNTANTANSNASTAVSTANTALSTANTALTNSSTAITTANSAIAAVASAVIYTPVANLTALAALTPVNGDYFELTDSTGAEGSALITGVTVGLVGAPGLTFRLRYDSPPGIYTFLGYFANDSETRYLKFSGGTLTGQLRGDDSTSAATPGFAFDGDPNTGIYRPGADQVAISTNGTGRLFVDSGGGVGINVANPATRLDVNGNTRISGGGIRALGYYSDGTSAYNVALGTTGNVGYLQAVNVGNLSQLSIDGSPIVFRVGSYSEAMRLDASGRLGVGTSSPGNKLAVIGTTGALADSSIRINGTAGTPSANSGLWITGNQTTSHHNWLIGSQYNVNNGFEITPSTAVDGATFSTPALVVTSAGRVGLGTSSPQFKCVVSEQGTGVTSTLAIRAGEGGSGSTSNIASLYYRIRGGGPGDVDAYTQHLYDGSNYVLQTNSNGGHQWQIGGTERARIDSSGRLLVGTSSAFPVRSGTAAITPQQQLAGTNGTASTFVQGCASATDSTAAFHWFAKFASGTINDNATSVADGEVLGIITWSGSDGANQTQAAIIRAEVDGTPGANDMPGRIILATTADGGTSPTERMRIANNGAISTVVPGGSTLYPAYDCRAWVNFNGTGTVAIRGSGNVSSITDNGTGDYTINFTTAFADVNYAAVLNGRAIENGNQGNFYGQSTVSNPTTSTFRMSVYQSNLGSSLQQLDQPFITFAAFR
jgi:hypothetical protein